MGTVVSLEHVRSAEDELDVQQRFQAGDPKAFEQLVAPFADDLYTFCLRVSRREEDARDLAQDVLVLARRKHATYRPGMPVRPWLLTIARNLWRSRLRSPWHRLRQAVHAWTPESDSSPGPAELAEEAERDEKVRTVLATLPPIYREAVSLFHLADMSYAEMEGITGASTASLKQRVRRGNTLLAEKISKLYPELVPVRTTG